MAKTRRSRRSIASLAVRVRAVSSVPLEKTKANREKISIGGSAVAMSSCKKGPFPPGWKSREGRWIVQEAGEGRGGCIRTEGGARVVACIRGGRGGGRGGEGTGGIELYEMWAGACARSLLS